MVLGAIRDHRADRAGDLREQWANLGRIALLVARQFGREDLTTVGIDRGVEFTPSPLAASIMLLGQPLSRASAVASARPGLSRAKVVWSGMSTLRPSRPTSERGRPYLLPETAERETEQIPGLDRRVGVVARVTALARARRLPGSQRLGRDPDREVAAPLQRPVVLRPVLHAVARRGILWRRAALNC